LDINVSTFLMVKSILPDMLFSMKQISPFPNPKSLAAPPPQNLILL
jgi:hypothetical protein